MKWVNVDGLHACEISSELEAMVFEWGEKSCWAASIVASENGMAVFEQDGYPNEVSAKAAVCHWIGKTMAQFSNALAAGCPQVDEE